MEKAEKYSSPLLENILARIKPIDFFKTEIRMGLSATISDLLIVNKINKQEFAALVNKNPSEISKWLSGTHNFTIDTLSEICFALKISMEDLFKKSNPKDQNTISGLDSGSNGNLVKVKKQRVGNASSLPKRNVQKF
jgi:transcriptional regulator with XRE-family HTH domain